MENTIHEYEVCLQCGMKLIRKQVPMEKEKLKVNEILFTLLK